MGVFMATREYLGVRVGANGMRWLDTVAENETARTGDTVTRTDVVRASLSVAKSHEKEVIAAIERIRAQI